MKKNQKYNDKYDNIIMCLDSMEEKNKRHAIVDIEYMLEEEYEFIRTADKQSKSSNYNRIIEYLDSLDEKKCRHAIVDVEYILETQYNFKKNNRKRYLSVYQSNRKKYKDKQHKAICFRKYDIM